MKEALDFGVAGGMETGGFVAGTGAGTSPSEPGGAGVGVGMDGIGCCGVAGCGTEEVAGVGWVGSVVVVCASITPKEAVLNASNRKQERRLNAARPLGR